MQEFLGSVRRSLVMGGDDLRGVRGSGLAEKIGSCLRKSRAGLLAKARPALPAPAMKSPRVSKEEDVVREIRWRRGEMIGCGAYGRVYMGMDLDSGELLAIKQVSIAAGSKDKAQTHIRELEEEVKLLKNLSHPNIVRYLGTAREDETLNILLEFVPGGSISSLLGKFGSFTEEVIRTYTKQLLEGLEYLHSNGIIHRDIKGANILVDKNGRIKLADFGASKQVVELATVSGAKSMKGTPYWMAPEVILQTGHTFSADIWSVGCTFIEMATGKPPWSQQYQEVAALFHIGTTKSHPPIPDHLSLEAKDFLSKCLQKEPKLRPSASDLLQHPFVIRECKKTHPIYRTSTLSPTELTRGKSNSPTVGHSRRLFKQSTDLRNNDSVRCSTVYPEKLCCMENMWTTNTSDDMCRLDDDFDEGPLFKSDQKLDLFTENVNPVSDPMDAWTFDESPQQDFCGTSEKKEKEFTFPCSQFCEDDEEVTELKIKEFLDVKAAELKKLQSPLFEEFYKGSSTPASERVAVDNNNGIASSSNLPPKSKSPNRTTSKTSPTVVTDASGGSPASFFSQRLFNNSETSNSVLKELPIPQVREEQPDQNSPSAIFSERQKKWKEELDQELERERVMKRLAEGTGSKASSPVDKGSNRKRERLQRAFSPGKLHEL